MAFDAIVQQGLAPARDWLDVGQFAFLVVTAVGAVVAAVAGVQAAKEAGQSARAAADSAAASGRLVGIERERRLEEALLQEKRHRSDFVATRYNPKSGQHYWTIQNVLDGQAWRIKAISYDSEGQQWKWERRVMIGREEIALTSNSFTAAPDEDLAPYGLPIAGYMRLVITWDTADGDAAYQVFDCPSSGDQPRWVTGSLPWSD